MVKQFRSAFNPAWLQRAKELGMSVHQVVTLASIIEKETGAPQERALISSVFYNRLKRGMRLESDPTVIYGIPDFDGNLTRRDLETYTPYNTYMIKGLPPGPIASPGAASLKAALYPADTHFLYFVSKKDGTHKFSTTIKEHIAAVRKYQLGKK
jgi:peptidoglycan lytic transglycosylase G